jgi:hypothetical protein
MAMLAADTESPWFTAMSRCARQGLVRRMLWPAVCDAAGLDDVEPPVAEDSDAPGPCQSACGVAATADFARAVLEYRTG